MIHNYDTLKAATTGSYQESGSKFLAFAYPVQSREDVDHYLQLLKGDHPKARHHCFAYRIIAGNEITEFSSDAGEPSGSAGSPMLGELRRQHLVNVCAVVVRYFGGTKLGIPGLIHAYRESVHRAIAEGEIISKERNIHYHLKMPLSLQPHFYQTCKQLDIAIDMPQYTEQFEATISVPLNTHLPQLNQLLARLSGMDGSTDQLAASLEMQISVVDPDQAT